MPIGARAQCEATSVMDMATQQPIGHLNEHERLRQLRTFDKVVPRIPTRSWCSVENELSTLRRTRRTGGRKSLAADESSDLRRLAAALRKHIERGERYFPVTRLFHSDSRRPRSAPNSTSPCAVPEGERSIWRSRRAQSAEKPDCGRSTPPILRLSRVYSSRAHALITCGPAFQHRILHDGFHNQFRLGAFRDEAGAQLPPTP